MPPSPQGTLKEFLWEKLKVELGLLQLIRFLVWGCFGSWSFSFSKSVFAGFLWNMATLTLKKKKWANGRSPRQNPASVSSAPLNLWTLSSSVWPDISQPPRSSRRSRLQKRPLASKWRTSTSGATSCRGGGGRERKKRFGRYYFLPERTSFHLDSPSSLHFTSFLSNTHMQKTREKKKSPAESSFFVLPRRLTTKTFFAIIFLLPHRISPLPFSLASARHFIAAFYSGF